MITGYVGIPVLAIIGIINDCQRLGQGHVVVDPSRQPKLSPNLIDQSSHIIADLALLSLRQLSRIKRHAFIIQCRHDG